MLLLDGTSNGQSGLLGSRKKSVPDYRIRTVLRQQFSDNDIVVEPQVPVKRIAGALQGSTVFL
jgi:hypothetical protein